MIESNLPINMGFAPWAPETVLFFSNSAKIAIKNISASEVFQNIEAEIYTPDAGNVVRGVNGHP
jgi:hypothetical protein